MLERLYLCTGDRDGLEHFIADCVRGGVGVVQLREKHLEPKELIARAEVAGRVCAGLGVPFILNDRPDLALECGAAGVHVGQDDVSARTARAILGPEAIIGLSTHSPAELAMANEEPVDYISAGPVFETPTKPGRMPTGIGYLSFAAETSSKPFFVTGGVNPDCVDAMVQAGARHFVAVRFLTQAPDPYKNARLLSESIERAIENFE